MATVITCCRCAILACLAVFFVRADAVAQLCAGRRETITGDSIAVFNGSKAEKRHWPFMAVLRASDSAGKMQVFCGGTVVAPDTVLTAGHCLSLFKRDEDGKFRYQANGDIVFTDVVIGVADLTKTSDVKANAFGIKSLLVHPAFIKELQEPTEIANSNAAAKSHSDIALIRLSSRWTGPLAPLLPDVEMEAKLAIGHAGYVAGYGIYRLVDGHPKPSPVLLEGLVKISKSEACGSGDYPNRLCATAAKNADSCNGDSGGPLTVYEPLTGCPYQAGIVSFREIGPFEQCATKPSWYTRLVLPANQAWLQKNIPKP